MTFVVKQEHFEGPLDLLLALVEKRKLFINDIALAKVADDFIEYVKKLGQFPIGDSANFILIASTLLLIKSKSLLPNLALTQEEEENIHDLELRLKIYQRIKEASGAVKDRFGVEMIFPRSARQITPVFSPDERMTLASLASAIRDVLASLPKVERLAKAVVQKVVSLEEMIGNLTERVKKSLKMSFRDFASIGKTEKVNVIVSFLAMLELVKEGVILVTQESHKDDIIIETRDISVPRY